MFATPQDKLQRLLFHDPEKFRPDLKALSDEQLAIMARNRETLALLAWEPYMHNPKLIHRLHRVTAPTLFLRGESDGLVSADYLDRYARLVPNSKLATIAQAGHVPQLEQPQATADKVLAFLGSSAMRAWHFSENAYPVSSAGEEYESIRVTLPNRNYDPQKGAALYDRFLDEWCIAEDEGMEIMLNEHHQTATCVDPAAPLVLGGAGAADQQGAAADPRQSDCQSPAAGARRRRDGDGGHALARPPRVRLRARRAL